MNMKFLSAALILTTSTVCASQDTLISLINGESRHLASNQDRYNFLRYSIMKEQQGLETLTVCSILSGKSIHLSSEFSSIKDDNPRLYRDFAYCHYLYTVGVNEPFVENVDSWINANESGIAYNYSYESVMDHYSTLGNLSDWDCKQFYSYLREYEQNSNKKHPNIWAVYTHQCNKKETL